MSSDSGLIKSERKSFCYLLIVHTAATGSGLSQRPLTPTLPSFHKFPTVYFALQNKCASRRIIKAQTRGSWRKTETFRTRPDFRVETSPIWPRKGWFNQQREKLSNSLGWSRLRNSRVEEILDCNFEKKSLAQNQAIYQVEIRHN